MFSLATPLKDPSKRLYPDPDDDQVQISGRNGDPTPLAKRQCTYYANHGDETLVGRIRFWRPPPPPDEQSQHTELDATFLRKEDGDGVEFARKFWALPETEGNLVRLRFSVDASTRSVSDPQYRGSPGAFSVVCKKPGEEDQYVEQAWFVDRMFNNNWGELMAITEAINMAVLRLSLMPSFQTSEVYIFTDSEPCIKFLMGNKDAKQTFHGISVSPLRKFIAQRSKELRQLRCDLVISQIRGHRHDIKSHQLADDAAYNMFHNGIRALDEGRIPAAYHCNIDGRTMPAHNTIWPVLHGKAVSDLDKIRRPAILHVEETKLLRLWELLALPSWRREAKGNKDEIRALQRRLGYPLLPEVEGSGE